MPSMTTGSGRIGHSLTGLGAVSSPALRFTGTSCSSKASQAPVRSDVDALDLVERDLLIQPVVELGGAGGLVPRDPGGDLEVAAVSQVLGVEPTLVSPAAKFFMGGGPSERPCRGQTGRRGSTWSRPTASRRWRRRGVLMTGLVLSENTCFPTGCQGLLELPI